MSEDDTPGRESTSEAEPERPHDWEPPALDEMSLGQRIITAWVQDPLRGVLVVFLLLFALSFLIAFAMWLV